MGPFLDLGTLEEVTRENAHVPSLPRLRTHVAGEVPDFSARRRDEQRRIAADDRRHVGDAGIALRLQRGVGGGDDIGLRTRPALPFATGREHQQGIEAEQEADFVDLTAGDGARDGVGIARGLGDAHVAKVGRLAGPQCLWSLVRAPEPLATVVPCRAARPVPRRRKRVALDRRCIRRVGDDVGIGESAAGLHAPDEAKDAVLAPVDVVVGTPGDRREDDAGYGVGRADRGAGQALLACLVVDGGHDIALRTAGIGADQSGRSRRRRREGDGNQRPGGVAGAREVAGRVGRVGKGHRVGRLHELQKRQVGRGVGRGQSIEARHGAAGRPRRPARGVGFGKFESAGRRPGHRETPAIDVGHAGHAVDPDVIPVAEAMRRRRRDDAGVRP